MSIHFNFQAIDKELELKEGFENYSSPHQRPAPVAKPWSHPMIQQQQQQPGKLCNQNQTNNKLTRVRSQHVWDCLGNWHTYCTIHVSRYKITIFFRDHWLAKQSLRLVNLQ